MRPSTLLSYFSTAAVALNIDPRYEDERRALEARALTTLYTTTTVYTTTTSKSSSCAISLGKACLLSATKTVTSTIPVRTTVVPYTTKSVADPTSTKASSTSTSTSTKTSTTSSVRTSTSTIASSTSVVKVVSSTSSSSSLVTPASSSSAVSSATTSTSGAIAEPTCGLVGWEKTGTNIGYYVSITTYSACNDLCNGNTNCLSLGYGSASNGTCILYNHVVEGNVTADSTSPWIFFNRGSVCPTSTTASAAAPSYTAGVQYCATGYTTYNVTAPVTGYAGCNATYPYSTCASGVDGSALCNLCGSCTNDTACTSTSQCQTTYGAGYACVSGSACVTGGTPVCLYMLAGGDAHGCYGSHST